MHDGWRASQHQAVVGRASKQPVLRCVHVQCCVTASSLAGRCCSAACVCVLSVYVCVCVHLCAMDSSVMPAATQASYSFTSPSADTCTGSPADRQTVQARPDQLPWLRGLPCWHATQRPCLCRNLLQLQLSP